MSDRDASTPRVFLVSDDETIWTITGQYTSTFDMPLASTGTDHAIAKATHLIGPRKLIDPARVLHVYSSPRNSAFQTFAYLFKVHIPMDDAKVTVAKDLVE